MWEDSHWIAEKEYHFQTRWEVSVIFSLKLDKVTEVTFQKNRSRCGAPFYMNNPHKVF